MKTYVVENIPFHTLDNDTLRELSLGIYAWQVETRPRISPIEYRQYLYAQQT